MSNLIVDLRRVRAGLDLSQSALAHKVGISRQAYAAIEGGSAIPSTDVALRLVRELGTPLEELFKLPDEPGFIVEAELMSDQHASDSVPSRVELYHIGHRWVARSLEGKTRTPSINHSLPVADGMIRRDPVQCLESGHVSVEVWQGQRRFSNDELVMVGCDPAMSVVASYLQQQGVRLICLELSSRAALEQVAQGKAHIAGCHLADERTGQFNVPWAQRLLPFPATIITFAIWQQGIFVRPDSAKHIRGIADLARPGVSIINREMGSGSRALFDEHLFAAAIPSTEIAGYHKEARSHLMVAELVAMGMADAGIGVQVAAGAAGLDFVPLGQERYDLVIPNHFLELSATQQLLKALKQAELRRQIELLGGYDTSAMGIEVASV